MKMSFFHTSFFKLIQLLQVKETPENEFKLWEDTTEGGFGLSLFGGRREAFIYENSQGELTYKIFSDYAKKGYAGLLYECTIAALDDNIQTHADKISDLLLS